MNWVEHGKKSQEEEENFKKKKRKLGIFADRVKHGR